MAHIGAAVRTLRGRQAYAIAIGLYYINNEINITHIRLTILLLLLIMVLPAKRFERIRKIWPKSRPAVVMNRIIFLLFRSFVGRRKDVLLCTSGGGRLVEHDNHIIVWCKGATSANS